MDSIISSNSDDKDPFLADAPKGVIDWAKDSGAGSETLGSSKDAFSINGLGSTQTMPASEDQFTVRAKPHQPQSHDKVFRSEEKKDSKLTFRVRLQQSAAVKVSGTAETSSMSSHSRQTGDSYSGEPPSTELTHDPDGTAADNVQCAPPSIPLHQHSRFYPRSSKSRYVRYYGGVHKPKIGRIAKPSTRLECQQQETALNCYAPAEGMAWPYLEGEEVLVRSLSAIEDDTSVVNMPEAERKHFRLQVKLSVHASLSVALQKVATLCETNVDLNRQRILQDLYQDLSRLPETTKRVGLMKLWSVCTALVAIVVDICLLVKDSDRFLAQVHCSPAHHFEGEFAAHCESEGKVRNTNGPDPFGFVLATPEEEVSAFTNYMYQRFIDDLSYCANVGLTLV